MDLDRIRSKSPRVSFLEEVRDGVDKGLVFFGMRTIGNHEGLAVRFGYEFRRIYVRHPNLDRPQSLAPKLCSVRPNAISG